MSNPLRIGLIGCGRISGNHIRAMKELSPDVCLAGVFDREPERAKALANEHGVTQHQRYEDLLASDIDAVSICSPSGLHPEHGIMAAQAGKHVITEKPMGVRLEDCDRLIAACDDAGVSLFVVKQNRLNTTMQLLKRAIEKKRFGTIYGAYCNVFWQRPQSYYNLADWRGTWEFDGGAFMNQASHYVDSLLWLVGDVSSVMAMTGTLGREIQAEDSGSVVLQFQNGAIGSMNVSMLAYPKNMEGSVTIIGEKGTVKLGGVAINQFEKWEFADYDDDDKLVHESNYQPPNVYGFGHTAYYRNVLDALNGQAAPHTDGRSGRKSVELVLAIYKSSREGVKVSLPL